MSLKLIDMSYLSQPTLTDSRIYFISEEDLWSAPLEVGSDATRLTAGLGPLVSPKASPDGNWIAVGSEEEGHCEIYILPSLGGELKRLTYLGGISTPVTWIDSKTILFKSNYRHAHQRQEFFQISIEGGNPVALNFGEGTSLDLSAQGVVIERNMHRPEPAHWKRYRGGTMGQLWVGKDFDSKFTKFTELKGNLARPLWHQDRIFYLSDETGLSRIYSCDGSGKNKKAHGLSFQSEFYFRNLCSNGKLFAFQSAGDLFTYDPVSDQIKNLNLQVRSDHSKMKRKTVTPFGGFQKFSLQPQGEKLLLEMRGKIMQFAHWTGPSVQIGSNTSVRYKNADWLSDGKRVALIADDGLSESIELFTDQGDFLRKVELKGIPDLGRTGSLIVSPKKDELVISNHRNELIHIDLESGQASLIFQNKFAPMDDFSFSPDGRFVALSESLSAHQSRISVYEIEKKTLTPVTTPLLVDYAPRFDPSGKYLYFLSKRVFNPIYDDILFDMTFAKGSLPFLVTLRKSEPNPFIGESKLPDALAKAPSPPAAPAEIKCEIEFEGIENRILQFPVGEAKYTKIIGFGNKVLWTYAPVEGSITPPSRDLGPVSNLYLDCFDFATRKFEYYGVGINDFEVRPEAGLRIVRKGNALQILKATDKPVVEPGKEEANSKTGIIDLSRVKTLIEPREEWVHMYKDVWRIQKEFFWDEKMKGIDWDAVYARYLPVLNKVTCRREFSDLVWEIIGELGTSHAYDLGGDYRGVPIYAVGGLGAELKWNAHEKAYEITRVLKGDPWNPEITSPLIGPGVGLEVGDFLLQIAHQTFTENFTPHQAALGLAGSEVWIKFKRKKTGELGDVVIRLLKSELALRYREWVENNRKKVKELSKGKLGYVHIPNMVGYGFAEFHRGFLQELSSEGLVIDVRYNGGGHVSQLILDRLARKPIGKNDSRWFGSRSVPFETPKKLLIAVTNEFAGSDGDIFSHTFKMRKLGKLIGTRTWGGTVGIWPRNTMIDGGHTTQPEFALWFQDVEYKLENYGTDPDVVVEFPPEAWRKETDPQLEYAVKDALKELS